jgi:hypothetical protein
MLRVTHNAPHGFIIPHLCPKTKTASEKAVFVFEIPKIFEAKT